MTPVMPFARPRIVDDRASAPVLDPEPFARAGYARLRDLETERFETELRAIEDFHARFLARTHALWTPDLMYAGDKLYNWSRRWEYPYCLWNLEREPAERVLDAGSGLSFFPWRLAEEGREVHACDLHPKLPGLFERANAAMGSDVRYRRGAIEALPYADATFDAVLCVSVLEHVPRRFEAMDEFVRVLRPGGRLILTWDVSLSRDCDVRFEDVAVLLAGLTERFEPVYAPDLHRPTDLLTTDRMLEGERWRLSWRPHPNRIRRVLSRWLRGDDFRSLAVMGSVWRKPR